jgi:two-component system LytT family sensor kinase
MRLRYFMEFPNDVILYILFASFTLLFDRYRAARDNDVRLAELEAEMSRVRLQALESRLQPHFLFNALNTVSAVMYESVDEADRVLTRLAELLRRTLRHEAGTEVTLDQEIETLELYLTVIRARFGDRLTVTVDVDDEARAGAVPPLLLQPLVENALKHGDPGPGQPARVDITARRTNGALRIEVCDNGPGLRTTTEAALDSGIGLSTTCRRLQRHYGDVATLSLTPRDGGGLITRVVLPFRALASS